MTIGETTDLTCDVCGRSSFVTTITWYPGGAQRCAKHQLRQEGEDSMLDAHDPAWNGDGTAKLMEGVSRAVSRNGHRIVDEFAASAMAPRVTWWQRLKWRVFPIPSRPLIAHDRRTFITTELHVHLGWTDRLGVLVFGRLRATVVTYTDVEVKEAESKSVSWVE